MNISILPIERAHLLSDAAKAQFILDLGKYISDSIISNTENYSKYVTIDLINNFGIPQGDVEYWIDSALDGGKIKDYNEIVDEEAMKQQRIAALEAQQDNLRSTNSNLNSQITSLTQQISSLEARKNALYKNYQTELVNCFRDSLDNNHPSYFFNPSVKIEDFQNTLTKVGYSYYLEIDFEQIEKFFLEENGYKWHINTTRMSEDEMALTIKRLVEQNAPMSHFVNEIFGGYQPIRAHEPNLYSIYNNFISQDKYLESSIIQANSQIKSYNNQIEANKISITKAQEEIDLLNSGDIEVSFTYYYLYRTYNYNYTSSSNNDDANTYVVTTNLQPKGFILFWNDDGRKFVDTVDELATGNLAYYYQSGSSIPHASLQEMINAINQYNTLIGGN